MILDLVIFDRNEVDSLIDELVVSTKKLVKATTNEIEKWIK